MTTTQSDTRHPIPTRLDVDAAVPSFSKAMAHLDTAMTREADRVGIPKGLRDLLKLRASQINGCGPCVDSGARAMKKNGETDERLFVVAAWREATCFTDAERAALAGEGRSVQRRLNRVAAQ